MGPHVLHRRATGGRSSRYQDAGDEKKRHLLLVGPVSGTLEKKHSSIFNNLFLHCYYLSYPSPSDAFTLVKRCAVGNILRSVLPAVRRHLNHIFFISSSVSVY